MPPEIFISPDIVNKVSYKWYFYYSMPCINSFVSVALYYQLDAETKTMVKNEHINTTKNWPPMLFLREKIILFQKLFLDFKILKWSLTIWGLLPGTVVSLVAHNREIASSIPAGSSAGFTTRPTRPWPRAAGCRGAARGPKYMYILKDVQ
jgi:hypothetical protein